MAVLLALGSLGCPSATSPTDDAERAAPLAGVKLRVLVIGDEPLAEAAVQLEGEWNAQTGAAYEIERIAESDAATLTADRADVVLCPAYMLGPLAQQGILTPMPQRLLDERSHEWRQTFALLRDAEARWGSQILGVPLGSPALVCYYRPDLLERVNRQPPETWEEYRELAELLGDRANLGDAAPPEEQPWYGAIEPLGPGWAGLTLLARAAPYAKHRSHYSTWFDIGTMEPLIAGPPVVRALEELVAVARLGPEEQLQYDPAAVRAAFWEGRSAMAIAWPTASDAGWPADGSPDLQADDPPRVGFAELPGSREVFDLSHRSWTARARNDRPGVPLLAVSGRLGAVTADSPHQEAAFRLLFWLTADQTNREFSPRSAATTLFRHAQAKSPGAWVERMATPEAAGQYGRVIEATLGREQWVFALRIPGRGEYLAALDEAVDQAIHDRAPPLEALYQASRRWNEITDRLGREQQRAAYLNSLGLD